MSGLGSVARPYIGLRYFEEGDAHLFYGRDEHVAELLAKVAMNRFVSVMGSSGSGKSSLVRAGLLPELRSGMIPAAGPRWKVVEFKPGRAPLEALSAAVAAELKIDRARELIEEGPLGLARAVAGARLDDGVNVLVIADQFEEVFRFQREESAQGRGDEAAEQCRALVRRLLDAAEQKEVPIYVLLVMRSDYLGECAQFPDLPERMSESLYLVPRLRRDQLEEAITAPVGGRIEPAVVQRLLGEVGNDPDQLPRLQHLLGRMWDLARGGNLDMKQYEGAGGWEKGLEQHLEEVYTGLSTSRQLACERVFQRLSEIDNGRAVRRRADISELIEVCGPEAVEIVRAFRAEGFMLPQNSPVDITHECILREWPRVREWLESEERNAKRLLQLAEAAKDAAWQPGMSVPSDVGLEGLTLQNLVNWRNQAVPTAAWASRYLTAVDFATADSYLSWSERRDRESKKRTRRRKHLLVALLALVPIGLSLAGLEALRQKQEALRQKRVAETKSIEADKAKSAAQLSEGKVRDSLKQVETAQGALTNSLDEQQKLTETVRASAIPGFVATLQEEDPARALYLGWRAGLTQRALPLGLEPVLFAALKNVPSYGILRGHAAAIRTVWWSPDGKTVASSDDNGELRIWDSNTAKTLRTANIPKRKTVDAAWSPNGKLLALAGQDQTVLLYLATGGSAGSLKVGRKVTGIAWSPDSSKLAVVMEAVMSKGVQIWDVAGGRLLATLGDMQTKVNAVAWSPDGKTIALGGETLAGAQILLCDVTGSQTRAIAGVSGPAVTAMAWSPDAILLAVATLDASVRLWHADEQKLYLPAHSAGVVRALVWNSSGTRFASAGQTVQFWNRSGSPDGELRGHEKGSNAIAWAPGSDLLASAGEDGTVRLWEPAKTLETRTVGGGSNSVNSIAWRPDGKLLAAGREDGTIALYRMADGQQLSSLEVKPGREVRKVAWSPDGRMLAAAADGNEARILDAESHQLVRTFAGDDFLDLGWSRDSRALALTGDKAVRLWSAPSGKELVSVAGETRFKRYVAWSPDGSTLATGSGEFIRLLDDRGGFKREIAIHGAVVCLAWSPNGRIIAAGTGRSVVLVDTTSYQISRTLATNPDVAQSVAWRPDGKALAFAGDQGNVKIWDAETSQLLRTIALHTEQYSLAWSPDGKLLASGGEDGVIRFWPGSTDALLEQIRSRIRLFSLSATECRQYFGTDDCPAPGSPSAR